jgi:hypothetical protein
VKPQRERIKWNKREIKMDLSTWLGSEYELH